MMIILAILMLAASGCNAQEDSQTADKEIRGAWLHGWVHGYLSPQEVDETIAAAKKAGINALYIQVRKNGDAYYKSAIVPRATNIVGADFDPLEYAIQKAHAQGMQVHAWVNAFRVWSRAAYPSDPNHIVNAHPDWLTKDSKGSVLASEGVYLDPGAPGVRDYMAKVVMEIVKNYDVDGVQWDYIRYPGQNFGYADTALERFYAETKTTARPDPKDEKWSQWRRDQVTELVKLVYRQVKAVKPDIAISASTIAWGSASQDFKKTENYWAVYQDWAAWAADGILDANLPMVYKYDNNPKGAASFRGWLEGFNRWHGGKPTYVGVEVHSDDLPGAINQILATRKAGLEGFVLFDFRPGKTRDKLVDMMATQLKAARAPAASTAPKPMAKQADIKEARTAYARGIELAVANKIDEAIVQFKKAGELDPTYTEAYFRLGRCYLKKENYPEAKTAFQRTLELSPSYEPARKELQLLDKQK